jgi:hypothetical protein|tara:strand:+ start:417 stop:1166 length:750 start_codon:yes stop_codon:yes gene_type:complete
MFQTDFSYSFYKKIIDFCNEIGSIIPLKEYDRNTSNEINFIWRHDIDISLNYALTMAKIEAEHGIFSTYMIIPDSPLYQIQDTENRKILCEILEMGHEIALHFDIETAGVKNPADSNDINNAINRDIKKITKVCGTEVNSISFHRPLQKFLYGETYICGCLNAYSSELMEFYISDSQGSWREGNPLTSLSKFDSSVGQILTHPIWWAEKHMTPTQTLKNHLARQTKTMTRNESANYKEILKQTVPGVRQ